MKKTHTVVVDGVTITFPDPATLPSPERVVELEAAFDRVKNAEHWKGRIDAYVTIDTPDELAIIVEAVEFYTATTATTRKLHRVGDAYVYHVTAPGYFAGPAN